MLLDLFDFQQKAADGLIKSAVDYFSIGPDRSAGRLIPFVGQLKAVTGAGKTPILAHVISKFSPAIVLWTTKFGSVVDQTVANLSTSGKYHHLLGKDVEVVKFSDIRSAHDWNRILEKTDGLTVLVSTVAAWNSAEKDPRLNVHRTDNQDWGDKSRWDQLRTDRHRPLWVVYDEAHNTTTEQVELLDELDPAGFYVASASPVGGKLQLYLTGLSDEQRKKRIVPVRTRDVVDWHLLKSTISLADYQSSTEEMLSDVVKRRDALTTSFATAGVSITPKAIYVVEASNAIKNDESRPVAIWKVLVDLCGVDPASIAVCTNTKELPKDAVRVSSIGQLSDRFTHIIFNKKLQEGWDDPSVYVCYFDGKTESVTRIQQVLGRALRQPTVTHFSDDDLNTAYFFINCPNEALEKITDDLKQELRIYKGEDEPDDFEPFKIKEERKAPAKISLKPEWIHKLRIPHLEPELPAPTDPLRSLVEKKTLSFDGEDLAAPGKAIITVVSMRTGDTEQRTRNLLEDMRVRCGAFLQEQIRGQSKNCLNAMHPGIFTNQKLDKFACFNSKALEYYRGVATEVVREYETRVQLGQLADPTENEYVVGAYQPSGVVYKDFEHAGHPRYDAKAFNAPESDMAKALDKFAQYVWVRNKDRIGYGIPLPVKSGSSSTFYPDFLWWVRGSIWAIDPTGQHILQEKVRTKLLTVPAPLKIALLTQGKLDANYRPIDTEGWTLLRYRQGNAQPEAIDTLDEVLKELEAES